MDDWVPLIRWIHIVAGTSWLGEVVTINFVLVPAIGRLGVEHRRRFMVAVFPRIFRLASVLSVLAVVSGLLIAVAMSDGDLSVFLKGRWGRFILVGGSLGGLLTLFHFFLENRVGRILVPLRGEATDADIEFVYRRLKIIPRVGLVVITAIVVSMMYAARGI